MEPKIAKETLSWRGKTLNVYLLELENAVVGFFSEGEEVRLGTLALALPRGLPPSLGSSSILLGHRNAGIARILAEYLSSKHGKMALISVFLRREAEIADQKSLLQLAKTLKKP